MLFFPIASDKRAMSEVLNRRCCGFTGGERQVRLEILFKSELLGLDILVKGARLDEVEQVAQMVSSQSWCGAGAFEGGVRVRKATSWQKTAKPERFGY